MIIRQATATDLPTVLAMAVSMHAESSRYKKSKIAVAKLVAFIALQHTTKSRVILIAEREGTIVGMFWGRVGSYFFSETQFTADVLLYTKPRYRKGFVAYRLIKSFEAWSKELGISILQVGISTGIDNEGYAKFYERLGYIRTGVVLSKEI